MAVCALWHQVFLLQTSQTCYYGDLSLAEIPAWHAADPTMWCFHILTMKHTSDFFTIRVQKGSLSRHWLLRTWQNLEASHGFEEWPSTGAGISGGRAFFKKQLGLWHSADSSCRIDSGKDREHWSQMTSQSNQPFREVRSEREGGASALLFVHCSAPIMSKDNSFILCGQFMNFKFSI